MRDGWHDAAACDQNAENYVSKVQRVSAPAGGLVISSPGRYILDDDMDVYGDFGIRITASDVVLDLDGRTLKKATPPNVISFGIHSPAAQNLTIHNGNVHGFSHGVHTVSSRQARIFDVDASRSTNIGFTVGGSDIRVIGCQAGDIRGFPKEGYAVGVTIVSGDDIRVERCRFRNLYRQADAEPTQTAEGCGVICGVSARSTYIVGNVMINDRAETHTIGVFCGNGGNHVIEDNLIRNFHVAIMGGGYEGYPTHAAGNALWMDAALAASEGVSVNFGTVAKNLICGFERPGRSKDIEALNSIVARPML